MQKTAGKATVDASIAECIKTYAPSLDVCFVFPSKVVSRLWFHKALDLTGLPTLPADMFVAWDSFKTACLIADSGKAAPVSQVVRKLFAHAVSEKNRRQVSAGKAFFTELIPEAYAESSGIFADWIASLLPQLDHWEKRFTQSGIPTDTEAKDLALLKKEYEAFLQKHELFEPSWTADVFTPQVSQYIIVYPELIEDFSEYAQLLEACPEVSFLPIDSFDAAQNPLISFENTRAEIRNTVLRIEQLLNEGVSISEIVVSVPNIKEMMPYLKREFALRSITADFRTGFSLADNQAGFLFSQITDAVDQHYSFESMKALVFNKHIPWADECGARALMSYGIKNNCVVSWQDEKRYKNVWFESFKISKEENPAEEDEKEAAKNWIIPFMQMAEKLTSAKTFTEIQTAYFTFRDRFIVEDKFSAEDDMVMSRCLACLRQLSELEEEFKDCLPSSPYRFFITQLQNEIYVPQNEGLGIAIFPYRVAAGAPFTYHFVLNCNQNSTCVIYKKLPFLRQDKRYLLNVANTDASQAFFAAYAKNGNCFFSFAEQTISSFVIANSNFTQTVSPPSIDETDSFLEELMMYQGGKAFTQAYSIQKNGFEVWSGRNTEKGFSYLQNSFKHQIAALTERIHAVQFKGSAVLVNQTGLRNFFFCPSYWFLSRVLTINDEQYEAELFNPRYVGILIHEVLEKLYQKIKAKDTKFCSANTATYKEWAKDIIQKTAKMRSEYQGPLATPFIESLYSRIFEAVEYALSFDCEKLDGWLLSKIEERIEFESGGIFYEGIIDRVSVSAEGSSVLLDYKTGRRPPASSYTDYEKNGELLDFQMPMYVHLLEHSEKELVEHAFFIGLREQDVSFIINNKAVIDQGRKRSVSREQFSGVMTCFQTSVQDFAAAVKSENFIKPENVTWQTCKACGFKGICRTAYIVRGE
ncbi:hypothetical protein HMPREF9554_00325 [Treponema phagedenis F0421]|uniref:PD-(D/E)XK nuclease family protein n=1 Tax=Treponema phagedenis TaxID=162 RepID=UPI0001F63A12|nr:PD-(D/E)XK nuclease family protein [Treponema phagedenis]EFW39155.1 hypothetical protein HMPREF9554_00325 [Treponema phagedenis F0421]